MIFEHTIPIETDADKIFRFFENMEENYTRWHPQHICFRWEKGDGLKEGSISYFEEKIGDEHFKKKVIYTRVIPGRYIEFVPVNRLMRIFLRKMTFRIEPDGNQCIFTAQVILKWVGPIAKKLNETKFELIRRHMKEEGENLKKILEG